MVRREPSLSSALRASGTVEPVSVCQWTWAEASQAAPEILSIFAAGRGAVCQRAATLSQESFSEPAQWDSEAWYDEPKGLSRAEGDDNVELVSVCQWIGAGASLSLRLSSCTPITTSILMRGENSLFLEQQFETQDRQVPIFSVDSGLYFDRDTQWFGDSYRRTLEPRLFYLYVPEKDQTDIPIFDTGESAFSYSSLWRENRFLARIA